MSLYLKYRPSDFNNLVWQWFIKNTLQTAIKNNKTIWAYLFCWPRWTWKTSTARIFAKTVNCENTNEWNPCLKCDICKDFIDEKLIDIIEIDAASHTWVDNIREIIEKAQFSPTKTKFKIYIIDEVHMLSKWAFNALLKILEEPPSHVKFILATTETHKVPDTIISRCQRYDFKRISDIDIKSRLLYIAESEGVKIDEKSLDYIIKNSFWWLRNAISLFEQLISDWDINFEEIVKKLEIVNEDEINVFLEKLLSKDNSVIEILDKNISDWKNIKLLFKELIFFTKNKALVELKNNWSISAYINILDILDETYSKTKNSLDDNITFLIWVLKILDWWNTVNNSAEISTVKTNNKQKETNTVVTKKLNTSDSQIDHSDINDIFWDNNNIESTNNNTSNSSDFNIDNFILNLKKNWAKWWLTMAIRWTSINLKWEELIIWVKTKIAKAQFENTDNTSLIIQTLKEMDLNNPKITIS